MALNHACLPIPPPARGKHNYTPTARARCQGVSAHAPTHRSHPPLLPILYPHLKKAGAPPVESLRQRAQHNTRQRWNTYKEVYHMNPTEARKRIVHIYRDRTTMPHLPPTRAPVGPTRPPIRRTSTARPAQNPQTPAQNNRPRHRAARPPTLPKNPLRTPTPRPTPRPTRHSPLSQHPQTPRAHNPPPPQTAPTLLPRALGVGNAGTVHAHSSRCESHLRHGHARYGTLGSPAQAPPASLSVDCSGKSHALAPCGVQSGDFHAARDGVFEFGSELAAAVRGADRNDYPDRLG
jgi:hypothetical protein